MGKRESEASLFEDLREGKPGGWDRFVRRYMSLVYSVPRRMGLSDADAEEVTQATWIALHRHLQWIERAPSIASWVLTTAAREASRLQSRSRRREDIEQTGAELSEPRENPSPDDVLLRLERIQLVRDAIETLGPPCSELLSALYFDRDSHYSQVAERLGMPLGSLGPRRMRCLEQLTQQLGRNAFWDAEGAV